uniref:Lipocalin n=1 Tax=Rhipicephalus appendiculatus TaxID=34631 RepID=A0A131YJ07_RHIAP
MNYVVFALLLGTCGVNGVTLSSNATLQDIREFLNTTATIYVYATSDPSFFDYEYSEEEMNASCIHYRPMLNYTDNYVFNMSYILNSTWYTKNVSAVVKNTTTLKRPSLMETFDEEGSKELVLDVYNEQDGCSLFYTTGLRRLCEIHVLGKLVETYDNNTTDICRQRATKICGKKVYKVYSKGCDNRSS